MLKVSISGVRGLWASDLTPEVITSYTRAFVEVLRRNRAEKSADTSLCVVVGTDTRPSSAPFQMFVTALLQRWGVRVIDLGVLATPIVLFAIRQLKADAGIVITASHNPVEWNAFKFATSPGVFFTPEQMNQLSEYQSQYSSLPSLDEKLGTLESDFSLVDQYLDNILPHFDVQKITASRIKIVADVVNGTAASFFPILMQRLGLQYSILHQDTSKAFERGAEPKPENLTQLSQKILRYGASVGFAFDPDGDRLALINEKGEVMGENWTLALAYLGFLKYHAPKNRDITANLSTSILLDQIAKRNGALVRRTPVGEIYVTEDLLHSGGEIGGEGNGGVIYPALNPCRDSLIACLFILEYMAKERRSLSFFSSEWPSFHPLSFSISLETGAPLPELEPLLSGILGELHLTPGEIDRSDGIRISYPDGWIQIRHSNTEPILRVMGESLVLEIQEQLEQKLKQTLSS